jgi:hypothetical protein
MALKHDIYLEDNFGEKVLLKDLYIRVDRLDATKQQVNATVGFYRDGEIKIGVHTDVYRFAPALVGDNFITQAYEHLKTLPEFDGAVDC